MISFYFVTSFNKNWFFRAAKSIRLYYSIIHHIHITRHHKLCVQTKLQHKYGLDLFEEKITYCYISMQLLHMKINPPVNFLIEMNYFTSSNSVFMICLLSSADVTEGARFLYIENKWLFCLKLKSIHDWTGLCACF